MALRTEWKLLKLGLGLAMRFICPHLSTERHVGTPNAVRRQGFRFDALRLRRRLLLTRSWLRKYYRLNPIGPSDLSSYQVNRESSLNYIR